MAMGVWQKVTIACKQQKPLVVGYFKVAHYQAAVF
jgi:hypothetical protein